METKHHPSSFAMNDAAKKRRLARVLAALKRCYGEPSERCWGRGVDVLVGTILSQNTTDSNSSSGYRRLRRRFRSWERLADAPVGEIAECIRVCGLSRVKAPRIRRILRQIRQAHGRVCLEFLRDWPPQRAYDYLLGFEGVGPKTAACVLLFSFGMPVFPVDTHVVRMAGRLGLVHPSASAVQCQELLGPLIRPTDRYAMHVLMIAHGRKVCRARRPRCPWCDLLSMCPYGREVAASDVCHRADAAIG